MFKFLKRKQKVKPEPEKIQIIHNNSIFIKKGSRLYNHLKKDITPELRNKLLMKYRNDFEIGISASDEYIKLK